MKTRILIGGVALAAAVVPLGVSTTNAAGPATSAPAVSKAQRPPACKAIAVTKGRTEAAAGTTYYALRLTNRSAKRCTVTKVHAGFVNRHSILVGWPAAQAAATRWRPKVVRPGATVRATLAVPDYRNFPRMDCLSYTPWRLHVRVAADDSPGLVNLDTTVCTTRYGRSFIGRYVG